MGTILSFSPDTIDIIEIFNIPIDDTGDDNNRQQCVDIRKP